MYEWNEEGNENMQKVTVVKVACKLWAELWQEAIIRYVDSLIRALTASPSPNVTKKCLIKFSC